MAALYALINSALLKTNTSLIWPFSLFRRKPQVEPVLHNFVRLVLLECSWVQYVDGVVCVRYDRMNGIRFLVTWVAGDAQRETRWETRSRNCKANEDFIIWTDKSCSPPPTPSPSSPLRLVKKVRLVSILLGSPGEWVDTKCLASTSMQCSERSLALTILDDSIWSNDYIRSYSTAFSYSSSRILHQKNKRRQRKKIIISKALCLSIFGHFGPILNYF